MLYFVSCQIMWLHVGFARLLDFCTDAADYEEGMAWHGIRGETLVLKLNWFPR